MSANNIRARISQLHKTEAEWNLLIDFIPRCGEIIVFDKDDQYNYSRIKVGDGVTKLSDLAFTLDSAITSYFNGVIDCGRITK